MSTSTDKLTQLARIGSEFPALPEEPATLRAIVSKATEFVPGCTAAAVTQGVRGGTLRLAASTDPGVAASEEHQLALGEGPTPTTFASTEPTVVDLRHEVRWPGWVVLGRALELTALLTFILTVGGERLGVLSFYSGDDEGFSGDAFVHANVYTTYAAAALFGAHQASGLTTAVESRHRIGIAQGILMHRYSLSKEAAFQLLRRYSNATNTKLRDVAETVIELRDLPPQHRPDAHGPPCAAESKFVAQRGRSLRDPRLRLPPDH